MVVTVVLTAVTGLATGTEGVLTTDGEGTVLVVVVGGIVFTTTVLAVVLTSVVVASGFSDEQ